jgi:hypothetical protein
LCDAVRVEDRTSSARPDARVIDPWVLAESANTRVRMEGFSR